MATISKMFNSFYNLKRFFLKFMYFISNNKLCRSIFNNLKFKNCNFSKVMNIIKNKVLWVLKNIFVRPISFIILSCNSYNMKSGDSCNFIFPKSDVMVGMIMLHDHLMFFIIMILSLKVVFLFSALLYSRSWMTINYFPFGYKKGIRKKYDVFYPGVLQFNDFKTYYNLYGKFEVDQFKHAVELEFIWTWIPALLLLIMAYPSFLLLYSTDQAPSYPLFNVCCFGNQWFWSYEYMDFDTHLFAWDKIEDILTYNLYSIYQYYENNYRYLVSGLDSSNIKLYNSIVNKYYLFNEDNAFKLECGSFNFKHSGLNFVEESIIFRVFNAKLCILNNFFGNIGFYSTHKTLLFNSFFVGYNAEQRVLSTFNFVKSVDAFDLSTENMDASITLDCQILGELDLPKGYPRLLSTDQVLVIPSDVTVRFLITSADVIHSWALPSFGIKMDAVPGRLNQVFLKAPFCGTVWGQCSELRGINHGFMPIEIRVLPLWEFIYFIKLSLLGLTLDKINYFVNNLTEYESIINISLGHYAKYDSEYVEDIFCSDPLFIKNFRCTDADYFVDLHEFMLEPTIEIVDYAFSVMTWDKMNLYELLNSYCTGSVLGDPLRFSEYIDLANHDETFLCLSDEDKEWVREQSLENIELIITWGRMLRVFLTGNLYDKFMEGHFLYVGWDIDKSPLEHFELKYFNSILFYSLQINIDNFYIYYLGCLIFIFIIWLSFKFTRFSKRLDSFLIWYFRFILELIKNQNNSWRNFRYLPLTYSTFLVIFMLNLFSLSPYTSSVSGHIMITLSLSLSLFIGVILIGFLNNRENFFYFFVPSGVPKYLLVFLIIIEILSFLIRPFSLSIRLFANMLAGHTLLNIFGTFTCYIMKKNFFLVFIPFIFCLLICLLEFGVAIIQAYVFTILLIIYISDVTIISH